MAGSSEPGPLIRPWRRMVRRVLGSCHSRDRVATRSWQGTPTLRVGNHPHGSESRATRCGGRLGIEAASANVGATWVARKLYCGIVMYMYEPGSRYWASIEPYWLRLNESWEDDPSAFLSRLAEIPVAVRHLYAGHWCQSEVRNGGLWQFFSNTTGILSPEAATGFRAIGALEWADVIDEAMRHLGSPYPRNRSERLRVLSKGEQSIQRLFGGLNDRFYNWLGDEYNKWERLADAYAVTS